ncbi:uncharacterized protein [Penaeus vannamei]|uniref:uncharacterized protein n=1 Tax=Penaeus vannamei TaxID=6689 RepID=UPI00387F5F70
MHATRMQISEKHCVAIQILHVLLPGKCKGNFTAPRLEARNPNPETLEQHPKSVAPRSEGSVACSGPCLSYAQAPPLPYAQAPPLPYAQAPPLPYVHVPPRPYVHVPPRPYVHVPPRPYAQAPPLPYAQAAPLPYAQAPPLPYAQASPLPYAQAPPLPYRTPKPLPSPAAADNSTDLAQYGTRSTDSRCARQQAYTPCCDAMADLGIRWTFSLQFSPASAR